MFTIALDMLRRLFALSWRAVTGAGGVPDPAAPVPGGDLIFRMRSWPRLSEHDRTAEVYRMLSVMSSQPVNRRWLLARSTMSTQALDQLLQQLVAEGSVEVIDPARFASDEAFQA